MNRKVLNFSLRLVLAMSLASCKTDSTACKEILFTHYFVSSNGFESNIVALCPDETSPPDYNEWLVGQFQALLVS